MRYHFSEFTAARLACAYFFACTGMAYGSIMSRLPALKAAAGLNDAQIGTALLCLGIGALVALPATGWAVSRWGSRKVQIAGGIALLCFPYVALIYDPWSARFAFALLGASCGLAEVPMNTQAILLEKRWHQPCMSTMHAMYSVGGLLGALSGSIFAMAQCPPLLHFGIVALATLCLLPAAGRHLLADTVSKRTEHKNSPRGRIPLVIIVCGLLAMCGYATDGSVAEWGGILLHDGKGASEQIAALAFAAFSGTMAIFRLCGDRFRGAYGNYRVFLVCAIVASCGMLLVLLSSSPWLCLTGYAAMGVGMSAIVPILFSFAGECTTVAPSTASSVVSTLGYGGQLMVPPLIGMLGLHLGLEEALWVVLGLCLCLVAGSQIFRKSK